MNRPFMPRMMRDGRNPYGSRGGYITSRDPRRRDGARMDYARAGRGEMMGADYNYSGMDYAEKRPDMEDYGYPFEVYGEVEMGDYARGRNASGQYTRDRHFYDPMYMSDYRYDYNRGYDYAGANMLSNKELMQWSQRLTNELEEKDKNYFKYENIEKKAKDMGIQFDKFTFDEFYLVCLMMYTDYCKTLGTANMDIYLKLGKDWLQDQDSELKNSEKLYAYYYYVIMGM